MKTHLDALRETWKYGVGIPHDSSLHQLRHRVNACMELMTSHRNYQWLRNLITGDEKWVMYVNHTHRRLWLGAAPRGVATPKTDPHPKKMMVSVWWGVRGIIHWELLHLTVPSLLVPIANNWSELRQNSRESRIEFIFCVTIPDHTLQSQRVKND